MCVCVDRYKKKCITFENGKEYVETTLENTVYLHIYIKTQNTILLAELYVVELQPCILWFQSGPLY